MQTQKYKSALTFKHYFFIVLILSGLLSGKLSYAQPREIRNIDHDWKFKLDDDAGAKEEDFNDSDWRVLNLPHDWGIESPFSEEIKTGFLTGYLPVKGVGWYRKSFDVSGEESNLSFRVIFDGVYMNSDVWINGHHLGRYPYGYNSFCYDLSPYIKEGKNLLAVRVDNSHQPNTRWYAGGGIYRHVWLVVTDPLHVGFSGILVTTPEIKEEHAEVAVRTLIENKNSNAVRNGGLLTVIADKLGKEVAKNEIPFYVEGGSETELHQKITVSNPELWSIDSPELYTLKTYIKKDGKIIDNIDTDFGIRELEFSSEKGFLLNGEQLKIKGVCLHHTAGCVGAAVPEGVWERQLKILKEMGCNAVRTAHNPFAPEFYDMCDRLGLLVKAEAFDELYEPKANGLMINDVVPYGYHIYFHEWGVYDLKQMIRRDRNHPSIFLWSVGNEVKEQVTSDGHKIIKELIDVCHQEDPTRPATSACNRIAREYGPSTTVEFMEELDIVSYNYVDLSTKRRELYFTIDKMAHPKWKMIGTENSAIYSTRGDYSLGDDPDKIMASYNTNMIDQSMMWKYILAHDFVMGDFMWTGVDYLGESGWPYIGPPTGVIDRCGFVKDSYYFYKSIWTEEPVVHLFPHWNWPGREGQIMPVVCYTNCDAVELFLNGKSYGEKRIRFPRTGPTTVGHWRNYNAAERLTSSELHLSWDVPYEPGVVKAVGKKNGEVVFSTEIKTTGEAKAIQLSADKDEIKADGRDVVHIKVSIVDKNGLVVPEADNLVEFTVEGRGRLIGVDNGDLTDHNSFKINQRNAFHGLCLAILQSDREPGEIIINAKSDKLKSSTTKIIAVK